VKRATFCSSVTLSVYGSVHEQNRDQDLQGSVVTQTVLGGVTI